MSQNEGGDLVVYTVNRKDFSAPDYYKVIQAEGYAAKGDSVRAEIIVDDAELKRLEQLQQQQQHGGAAPSFISPGGGGDGTVGGIAAANQARSPMSPNSPGSFRKSKLHSNARTGGSGVDAASAGWSHHQQHGSAAMVTTTLPNPIARQVVIRKFHQVCRDHASLRGLLRVVKLQAALGEAKLLDGILPLIDCYRPAAAPEDVYCATPAVECTLAAAIYSVESLEPRHILSIARELALALRMLHAHGIVVGDLKPDTIGLMTRLGLTNSVCITDLSIVHRVGETCEELGDLPSWKSGQLRYRAPEFALQGVERLGAAADMWSLGVVIAEMIARRPLFSCTDYISYVREVTNFIGTPPSASTLDFFSNEHAKKFVSKLAPKPAAPMTTVVPSTVSKQLLLDIQKLLRWDPATRMTAEQFLNSPVFEHFGSGSGVAGGNFGAKRAAGGVPAGAASPATKLDPKWAVGANASLSDMLAELEEYCVTME